MAKDWGLYTNRCLDRAEKHLREGKARPALKAFLEVCYLDLNGPENCAGLPKELLKDFPPFRPDGAVLAPVVVRNVAELARESHLTLDQVRLEFVHLGTQIQAKVPTPITPEDAWKKLVGPLQAAYTRN